MEDQRILRLSQMFDVLSDPNRLAIVLFLKKEKKSVSEITKYLGMSQSAVSHQLKIMRDTRILTSKKEGKTVYYSINDEHVENIVNNGLIHMGHEV